MWISAVLGALAGLSFTSTVLAETTDSNYFIIKPTLKAGQNPSFSLNDYAMTSAVASGGDILQYPVFIPMKTNPQTQFFVLRSSHGKYSNLVYDTVYPDHIGYFNMTAASLGATAAWQTVGVYAVPSSTALPKGNFYINETSGLQWTSDPSATGQGNFTGWLVCIWWLGQPQLFWTFLDGGVSGDRIPSSCVKVDLQIIYVNGTGTG